MVGIKLVFKEIEELVQEVRAQLTVPGSAEASLLDEQRLQLLMRIVKFVNGFSWLSHAKAVAQVKTFLRSRYNYEYLADQHGLSLRQAHKCISYAGERLRRRIGGTLVLIRSGHLVTAEKELALAIGTVNTSSLFIRGIVERFQPSKDAGVLPSECENEISFLSAFSNRNFRRIVAALDERKLRHLLHILLSVDDATYLAERNILWRCIVEGEFDVVDASKRLNEQFIYSGVNGSTGFE